MVNRRLGLMPANNRHDLRLLGGNSIWRIGKYSKTMQRKSGHGIGFGIMKAVKIAIRLPITQDIKAPDKHWAKSIDIANPGAKLLIRN